MKLQQHEIRNVMRLLGLSREQMAERMNVSLHTLDAYLKPDNCKAHRDLPSRRWKKLRAEREKNRVRVSG